MRGRFPGPRYMQAKNRLRKGLACPVLMIYSSQDKALGPELVKARRRACHASRSELARLYALTGTCVMA